MTIKLPKPVATVESWTNGSYWRNYKLAWHGQADTGENLYTEAQLKQAIKDAMEEAVIACNLRGGRYGTTHPEDMLVRSELKNVGLRINELKDQL